MCKTKSPSLKRTQNNRGNLLFKIYSVDLSHGAQVCAINNSWEKQGMEEEQETKKLESGEKKNNDQTQNRRPASESTPERIYDDRVFRFRTGLRS